MRLSTSLVLASLSVSTVVGGTFTNDLSTTNLTGITPSGTAGLRAGEMVITTKSGGQGGLVLDDLDMGAPIESFTATFEVRFAPGTFYPADGLFFSFGPGVSFPVEGPSGSAVGVEFDTYDNGAPDNVGIDVKVMGEEVATTVLAVSDLVDSQFHVVVVELSRNGTLNVSWDNRIIYDNLFLVNWSPVNGQFAFGHSTGYFLEECDLRNLGITTTVAGTAAAPTITAQPPASVSLVEGTPLTLRVGFDGSAPSSFQWNLNGAPIPGGSDPVLQIAAVPLSDNGGNITCSISGPAGSVTSQATTLTVTQDTNPPAILSVVGSDMLGTVTVTFSKPVLAASAQTAANYSITGLTINAAGPLTKLLTPWSLETTNDPRQVVLSTSPQTSGAAYTLVVNHVQDQTAAANTIAPNSQMTFHAFSYVTGYMSYDIYDNMGFTAGSLSAFAAAYSTLVPTRRLLFTSADTPDWEYGGNYGSVSEGLIIAPETGSYIFHVASDDQSELLVSKDDTPSRLGLICQVTTWSLHLDWAGVSMGMPDTSPVSGNRSNPISLVAGQKYFFRDLHVEGTGGDGISIGWELPSSHGTINVIPGTNLMALVNTDVPPIPALSISNNAGGSAVAFSGILQSAEVISGPWIDEPTAAPLVISPNTGIKFFRARGGE